MRGSISIAIPLTATSGQIRALASLLATVERQRWAALAVMFDKLDRDGAELPEPIEVMLGHLAAQLRGVAKERAEVEDEAARIEAAARAPVPR